jgi:transposase-like protein
MNRLSERSVSAANGGAAGKTTVFELLKRRGKVFVTVVPPCSKEALMPMIQGQILTGSTIHTDGWKAYDGLILNGYDHDCVYRNENEFTGGKCHVNGIEALAVSPNADSPSSTVVPHKR